MNMNTPVTLDEITDNMILMMAKEFGIKSTAFITTEFSRLYGRDANIDSELQDILLQMNESSFYSGFKVAKRIYDQEKQH